RIARIRRTGVSQPRADAFFFVFIRVLRVIRGCFLLRALPPAPADVILSSMATDVKPEVTAPNVQLIESDGEPLESHWHVCQIHLPLSSVAYYFRDRSDYYAGGNMFIYYSVEQARTRRYRGPDFFFVEGVNRLPMRRYWCIWQEDGRYPDLIVELLSPTTAKEDRTTKKELYQRVFKTHEYFCYGPDEQQLEGWRLGERQRYRNIQPNEHGWMWVASRKLW